MATARPLPIPPADTPAGGRTMSSAAEFVRQFGQWSRTVTDAPLFVTHHGRPTHVMLSVAAYDALRGDQQTAPAVDTARLARFAEWIDDGLLVCTADGHVTLANEAAHGLCALPAGALVGRTLWDALPQLTATVLGALVRRSIASGEPGLADMPSPFRAGRWLRVRARPADAGAAILLRDMTDHVAQQDGADATRALAIALDMQPRIGWLRLSPRGLIEQASARFCAMLALSEARLRAAALTDIVPRADRVAVRDWLEAAWRGGPASRHETGLLANDGGIVRVGASIAILAGPYAPDGAMIAVERIG